MTNWTDDETIKKFVSDLVTNELKYRQGFIPEHLAGNKFRVPPNMKEWMDHHYAENGGGSDFYYRVNVGYGPSPLLIDFAFAQASVTMTFLSPDGSRLFMLELIPLCHTRNEERTTIVAVANTRTSKSSQSTSQRFAGEGVGGRYDDSGPTVKESPVVVERAPWSAIAQEFTEIWGRHDPQNPQPEHVEVIGINGSGKSLWVCKAVQERMFSRHTACIILQSKPADETILQLGWPIITNGDVKRTLKERWAIYWPLTNLTGTARKRYQADM